MHEFSISDRSYLVDEETFVCLSPDGVASRGLRLWEECGRGPEGDVRSRLLAEGFPADSVEEFVGELSELREMLAAPRATEEVPPSIRSIELHVAHTCNLGCRYCFAGQGDYGLEQRLMPDEVAFRAVDMLVEGSDSSDSLGIVFFGGEPLVNRALIRRTITYAEEHHSERAFQYSITTNGTLIDEEAVALFRENKFTVVVSMDGVGETQDALRPYKNGRGSSADIVRNVQNLSKHIPATVRCTLTKRNLAMMAICDELCSIGFQKVHFAPVSAEDDDLRIDGASLRLLKRELLGLADGFIERAKEHRTQVFSGFDALLSQLNRGITTSVGCGAGRRLVAVAPDGDLYPCHRYVGTAAYKMGDVWRGIDDSAAERFRGVDTSSREDCRTCWIRSLCGGGCVHEASRDDGSIGRVADSVMCDYRRTCAEVAVDLLWRLEAEQVKDVVEASDGNTAC